MSQPKIALIGYRLNKGGAERVMANLSNFFHVNNIEVHNIIIRCNSYSTGFYPNGDKRTPFAKSVLIKSILVSLASLQLCVNYSLCAPKSDQSGRPCPL